MDRRCFVRSGVVGGGIAVFSGCLGGGGQSTESPAQSGSGSPCDNPRNIDYDAVDQYRDHGVYVKNTDDAAHTACVTVTKTNQEQEEEEPSSPPPLSQIGYAIQSGRAVEIFTFDESGRYTIKVSVEETTKTGIFEKTEADFTDGKTTITTFDVTSASSIQLTRSGDS
ncbi:MAG: hypothetical protein V5A40_13390 [Haloarculaceae archaeon]